MYSSHQIRVEKGCNVEQVPTALLVGGLKYLQGETFNIHCLPGRPGSRLFKKYKAGRYQRVKLLIYKHFLLLTPGFLLGASLYNGPEA